MSCSAIPLAAALGTTCAFLLNSCSQASGFDASSTPEVAARGSCYYKVRVDGLPPYGSTDWDEYNLALFNAVQEESYANRLRPNLRVSSGRPDTVYVDLPEPCPRHYNYMIKFFLDSPGNFLSLGKGYSIRAIEISNEEESTVFRGVNH